MLTCATLLAGADARAAIAPGALTVQQGPSLQSEAVQPVYWVWHGRRYWHRRWYARRFDGRVWVAGHWGYY